MRILILYWFADYKYFSKIYQYVGIDLNLYEILMKMNVKYPINKIRNIAKVTENDCYS